MRGLHVVVQDFQVRAQGQARLAAQRDARQALAHVGLVGAGGDAGVGVADGARAALGQHQRFHRAGAVRRRQVTVRLVVELLAVQQQQGGLLGARAASAQLHGAALQVVGAAGGHQRLRVVGVGRQRGVQVVGDLVLRAGRHHAQVLQARAGAQLDVAVQVLGDGVGAVAGAALVGFQQHAVRAGVQLDHQQRRFGALARLVAQLQHHRGRRPAGRGGDAQAQALAAQGAVRPGKRRGFAVAGWRQAGQQLGALGRLERVEPARVHAAGAAVAQRVQRPAGAGQGRGVAAGVVQGLAQPVRQIGRRQVVEGFAAPCDPALAPQVIACGQAFGLAAVHVRPPPARCARRSRFRRCGAPGPGRRARRCSPGPAAARRRGAAARSSAGSATRR